MQTVTDRENVISSILKGCARMGLDIRSMLQNINHRAIYVELFGWRPMVDRTEDWLVGQLWNVKDSIVIIVRLLRVYPWNKLLINVANIAKENWEDVFCKFCIRYIRTQISFKVFDDSCLGMGLYFGKRK
jgi:hypothetical protein